MPTRPCVVLLVEDSKADARLAKMSIAEIRPDAVVLHAEDGQDALDCLLGAGRWPSPPLRPDLILLDLNMPKMDGKEFLRAAGSVPDLPRIPVVVLTTSSVESDRQDCARAGASGYVVKPVDFDEYQGAIAAIGAAWLPPGRAQDE